MDECSRGPITDGIRLRGIDALRQQDHNEGDADEDVLLRAARLGRVLVTEDADLLEIGARYRRLGIDFRGIIFVAQDRVSIGQAVQDLELIARTTSLEDWIGKVEFLPI